jgi:hypothetical protein
MFLAVKLSPRESAKYSEERSTVIDDRSIMAEGAGAPWTPLVKRE